MWNGQKLIVQPVVSVTERSCLVFILYQMVFAPICSSTEATNHKRLPPPSNVSVLRDDVSYSLAQWTVLNVSRFLKLFIGLLVYVYACFKQLLSLTFCFCLILMICSWIWCHYKLYNAVFQSHVNFKELKISDLVAYLVESICIVSQSKALPA